ncbi:MAG TPA: hypothetical protein VKC51_11425 [Lacunisphaera sp.]|nr:hypothetical protein [Lacunisphaera sp.]
MAVEDLQLIAADKKPAKFILQRDPCVTIRAQILGGENFHQRLTGGFVLPCAIQDMAGHSK